MSESHSGEKSPLESWICGARENDEEALNRLAEYLLPKAFEFANRSMGKLSPVDDFEDVAVSAVKSICMRFRNGQNEFLGEHELGGLLRQFVTGKIRTRRKYHYAEKRNINLNAENEGPLDDASSSEYSPVQQHAIDLPRDVWLDEYSINLPAADQAYLGSVIDGLGSDIQGLFSELTKRLDENPRKVLILMTTRSMSNEELAAELDCAPVSIERYRRAIRRKLEEIVS